MSKKDSAELSFKSTAEIEVSKKLIEQVIGQENSVEIIKKAAAQKRNVLLVGLPGTGKCLTPETEILLGNGRTISCEQLYSEVYDLSEVENTNEKMVVLKASAFSLLISSLVRDSSKKFWIKKSKLLRISKEKYADKIFYFKTASGREIKVTPNHKLLSIDKNGFFIRKAGELDSGDFLAIPRKTTLLDEKPSENNVLLPLPPKGIFKKIKVPTMLTNEFASWLGHIIAEGSFCRNQIRFTSFDQHRRESFKELTESVFGIKPYMKGKDVFINSVELLTYLREIFRMKTTNARNKEIPEEIMKAPLRVIKPFLAKFFSGDGTFYRNSVELACSNKKMASQLVYLLLHFGIVARIKEKWDPQTKWTYYRIFVQGEFLKDFMIKIGCAHRRKFAKLQKYVLEKNFNTNVDVIPFSGELIRKARKSRGLSINDFNEINSSMISRYENGKRTPSRKALQRIVAVLEKRLPLKEEDGLLVLKSLAFSNTFWDKIVEVKSEDYSGFVYDIEIDCESHIFVAGFGGILSHNSMLAQAMAEILPLEKLSDILIYPNRADSNNPKVRVVKAGEGRKITEQATLNQMQKESGSRLLGFVLPLGWFILASVLFSFNFIGEITFAALLILGGFILVGFALGSQIRTKGESDVPKLLIDNSGKKIAPFIEATGARAGALLGDVRHDPLQCFYGFSGLYIEKEGKNGSEFEKKPFAELWDEVYVKYKGNLITNEKGYEAIMLPEKEKIYTLGQKDGKPVLSRILSLNRQPFEGELIDLQVNGKNLSVTPEHKVFKETEKKEAKDISEKDNLIVLEK
ncbi:MAG: LAGLIDADG family homing endonuclease [archaeon]